MAADAIELYLDLSTPQGALAKSLNDTSSAVLGPVYQGGALNLRVFPVVPTGNLVSPPFYSQLDLATLDFELVYGPRAGATAILAAQYVWTKQNGNDLEGKSKYFYATLDFDTSDLNTAIGNSETLERYLEFRLSRGASGKKPVHQRALTILASVKDPGAAASVPTPTVSYPTWDELRAQFVAWNNAIIPANAGRNLIFLSPDGTKSREIGVADDGSGIDNL